MLVGLGVYAVIVGDFNVGVSRPNQRGPRDTMSFLLK
jgi:hypothetical protein